jgi:hypothetical protein
MERTITRRSDPYLYRRCQQTIGDRREREGKLWAPSTNRAQRRKERLPGEPGRRDGPSERHVYEVDACVAGYKLENDSDFHVVLQGTSGETMIGEFLDPANCAPRSYVPGFEQVDARPVARWRSESISCLKGRPSRTAVS